MVAKHSPEPLDIRTRITAQATRLFAAHGFDATSLQAIADAVGVTKQAVLHHFPSKEHVRGAVLESIVAHWNATLPRLLVGASASEDRFDAVFGELHRFFASEPERARVVLREVLDRPEEMRRIIRGTMDPWLSAIASYIRAGQERGRHWADVDPEAYVVQVVQFTLGAAAFGDVGAAALEPHATERLSRELERIAKVSLFAEGRHEKGATKTPARRARETRSTR